MSWRVVSLVYSRKLGSQFRKAVMAYLADKASDGGEGVFCSKGTVARDLEASRSTVFKVIQQFEDEGLLKRVGTRSHRNGETVEYSIDLAKIEALELVRSADRSAKSTSPPDGPVRTTDPNQSAPRTPTSPPDGPKQSLEPSFEQEESAYALLGARADPPPKPPPKQFLPTGWCPTERDWDYAEAQGLTPEQIQEIADDFRGYWAERRDAKAKRTEDGWRRTWQDNIRRKAPQYLGRSPARRPDRDDPALRAIAEAARRSAQSI